MLPKVHMLLSKCKQSFHTKLQAGLCKLFNKQTVTTGDVIVKSFKIGAPIFFVLTVCFIVGTMVMMVLEKVLPESITNVLNSLMGLQAFVFLILFGAFVISGTLFGFNLITSKTGKKLLSSILPKPKPKAKLSPIPSAISAKYPMLSAFLRVLLYSGKIVTGTIRAVKHLAELKLAEDPKLKP